jgi:hypothetical protein
LDAWGALPLPQRRSIDAGSVQDYFRTRCGVALTMTQLQMLAFRADKTLKIAGAGRRLRQRGWRTVPHTYAGIHEFFLVLWIITQFRTGGSPDGVQPSLQNCFANGRCGLNEARKWNIWQSGTRPPAFDTDRTPHGRLANGCRRLFQGLA